MQYDDAGPKSTTLTWVVANTYFLHLYCICVLQLCADLEAHCRTRVRSMVRILAQC